MTFPEFNFKFSYTSITIRYSFDTTKTVAEFINYIINKVIIDFDIHNDLIVEIVEAGQNNGDADSEMANPIEPLNISFKNFYQQKNYQDLSFYIRVKTRNNNIIRNLQQMRRDNIVQTINNNRFINHESNI
jgi:hypothetical protein